MSKATSDSNESITYLNDYFDFSPSENRTYDRVFGNKAIFTNELLWRTLQEGVYDSFGPVSFIIMLQLGQKYGMKLGDRVRERFVDIRQAVRFLETYGLLAGWGRFQTTPFTLSNGKLESKITVTVQDNFFAKTSRKMEVQTPQCFWVAGILGGIVQGLLGEPHICFETKCMAIGDPHCEFIIIPSFDR